MQTALTPVRGDEWVLTIGQHTHRLKIHDLAGLFMLLRDHVQTQHRVRAILPSDAVNEVTHRCPPTGSNRMPCCGLPPGERLGDRMTVHDDMVTCEGNAMRIPQVCHAPGDRSDRTSCGTEPPANGEGLLTAPIESSLVNCPDCLALAPHAHKGYSEERCVRCGWVMGMPPLNCQNDDTPHVFPSQMVAADGQGRCCERGMFGDDHDCMKQDGAAHRLSDVPDCFTCDDQTAALILATFAAIDAARWPREGSTPGLQSDRLAEAVHLVADHSPPVGGDWTMPMLLGLARAAARR